MSSEPIIALQNVTYGYENETGQRETVLHQLNLQIEAGTSVAILGHNGSGKSTMAKLMNGLFLPQEGNVLVHGHNTRVAASLTEIRRSVGMIFQNPDNQIVGTSVEDDVAFGLENIGMEPALMRQRIDEALRAVGMEGFADRQPHRLSGGQKQRIAIAGIIAMRPSVIILDEATAMLDPQGRQEVNALTKRLNQDEGLTVINITHFPEEALDVDRVIVMKGGQVYLDGTPSEIFSHVEEMKKIGLDVPFAVRVRHQLAAKGLQLPPLLHQDELVVELCKLLSKT